MTRNLLILFISGICFSISAQIDSNHLPQDIENYYQAHNNIVCFTTAEERKQIRNYNEIPLTLRNDPKRLAFVYEQVNILIKMTDYNKRRSMRVKSTSFKFILPGKYAKIQKVSSNFNKKSKAKSVSLKIIFYGLTPEENLQYIANFNQFLYNKSKMPMISSRGINPPQIHFWCLKNGEWKKGLTFLQYL